MIDAEAQEEFFKFITQSASLASQGPLRYAFCAVSCKLSGEGPRQSWHHNSRAETKTHEGDSSLQTSLNCSSYTSNRMESHQNLHTHAVDSAIQLQGNNRVLKKRPPPISDEEQRLNRRQRCTLSQLRSGHCHLLQDYKHRVFVEPSDICKECGAGWRNPVRSISAFSYLDNGNLD